MHAQALTESGTHPFAVDFPQVVDIGKVQAQYFSEGSFGGYGESVVEKSGEHRILLHTGVKGTPAESLKAILYAPGCQIVTIDVPNLAESSHQSDFKCRPLPTIAFRGKIESREQIADPRAVVNVQYVAFWSHHFFGIADGIVSTFEIATVPLEPGSIFHVVLPDFSKDAVTTSYLATLPEPNAELRFMVRDAKTWNIIGKLVVQNARRAFDGLQIESVYPPEVVFTLLKM
jgi:hypothetical protein